MRGLLALLLATAGLSACASVPRATLPAHAAGAPHAPAPGQPPLAERSHDIQGPVRMAHPAPALALPELGPSASQLPGLTLEIEITTRGGASSARRTITRTATLTHVRPHGADSEWLFVRNPVDDRRVSALRIDHRHETIIEYSESELRSSHVARGWADVAYLGVDLQVLGRMPATGRSEALSGFRFEEHAAAGDNSGSVWWSHSAGVPSRILDTRSQRELRLRALRVSVNAALLEEPRRRFPGYAVLDVADFREKHHEH